MSFSTFSSPIFTSSAPFPLLRPAYSPGNLQPSYLPFPMHTGAFTNTMGYVPYTVKFAVNVEEQEETFYVGNVPNKGQGILASRAIRRGEFLFSEPPLFTLSPSPTNSIILGALSKCTRDQQRQYFALANSYRGRLLPALAIFETNFLLLGNGTLTRLC